MKKTAIILLALLIVTVHGYTQSSVKTMMESDFMEFHVTLDSAQTDTTINFNFLKGSSGDRWMQTDPNTIWILADTTTESSQSVGATDSLILQAWPLAPSKVFYDDNQIDTRFQNVAANDSTYLTPNTTTGLDFEIETPYVYSWEFDGESAGYRIKITYISETGGLSFIIKLSK